MGIRVHKALNRRKTVTNLALSRERAMKAGMMQAHGFMIGNPPTRLLITVDNAVWRMKAMLQHRQELRKTAERAKQFEETFKEPPTPEEEHAIILWENGMMPSFSSGVCENLTCGYGKLDSSGYWEFPLYPAEKYLEKVKARDKKLNREVDRVVQR